jgi:hypothetical protein
MAAGGRPEESAKIVSVGIGIFQQELENGLAAAAAQTFQALC